MEDRLKGLRDKLFRACEGYDADESIRAMASTAAPEGGKGKARVVVRHVVEPRDGGAD